MTPRINDLQAFLSGGKRAKLGGGSKGVRELTEERDRRQDWRKLGG